MSSPKVDVLLALDRPVLQIMDDHIQGCEVALSMNRSAKDSALINEAMRELRAARAAVAELIEAARFFEDESRRKYGDNTTGGARLRVALARIGGES